MFEKEAEEYGHEHCCDSCKNLQARYRRVFKDGAEFGYNKANEEMQAQIEKMKSDVELARDNANKTEDWGTFSVLNSILDDWEKVE